jgi:hypothetical protein
MNLPINPVEIDRLVDDELDPDDRRDLLLRLEATPDGWRSCALAFLEAQEFARASRAWTRELAAPAVPASACIPVRPRRPSARRFVLAATLIGLAFLAGLLAGGAVPARGGRDEITTSDPGPRVPKPGPSVTPASDIALAQVQPAAVSDYDKAKWNRLGYQIEQKRKLITVDLKDGRRVTVPVDDVQINFVGRPTY